MSQHHPLLPPPRIPEGAEAIRTRRLQRCDACYLPVQLCLCAEFRPISIRTQLVLLIHHVERIRTSNTGRLVERLVPTTIVRVHGDPTRAPHAEVPEGRTLLLFPHESAAELSPEMAREEPPPLLVIPDGTWQQAKRMVRRDDLAKRAEMVRLPEGQTTRYNLRRSTRPGTLSTMEAVAAALGILEGPDVEEQMLDTFETFVQRSLYVRTHGTLLQTKT